MLKRLVLFVLAAAAGWIAYRRARPEHEAAPFDATLAPAISETTRLPSDASTQGVSPGER